VSEEKSGAVRPSVGAIVLAAGGSKRLGFPKQLLTFRGEPLVSRAALAALNAGAHPVIVVIGADADLTLPVLTRVPGVKTVLNDSWQDGLASSLTIGLRALMKIGDCDGVILMLVDQPNVTTGAVSRLIAEFDNDHRMVAAGYAGVIGVPAIFGKEFFDDLLGLTGDTGAAQLLRSNSERVTVVPMPEAEMDVDTVADIDLMRAADTSEWPQ
jgi:CTP:molybdopterin cytidylyltransferase MocA